MARNREPVKPVDESESESSEEESDADMDPNPTQSKPQPQMAAKPSAPLPAPSSSEEEEDDSGSESESESDAPNSNGRPLAAKPVEEETPKPNRKGRSSKPAADPVTPAKSAAAKRPSEDTAAKDAKKAKKTPASEPDTAEKKSNLFQRLWSEEDEIVILQGYIDFQAKYKQDPIAHVDEFHDYLKNSLHTDGTRTQLLDKIRRMKKKYGNIKSKERDGKERSFSKPHEQMAYDLSKAIWGNEEKPVANGSVVKKAAGKKEADDVKSSGEGEEMRLSLIRTMEERVMIYGEKAFGAGDGEDEDEWNKLKIEELRLYAKQMEVKFAQAKLVLRAVESKYQ